MSAPKSRILTRRHYSGLLLAAPATLLLLALFILPAISVLPISLTDWEFGKRSFAFVGLSNFRDLVADPRFLAALSHTVIYTAVVVPLTVALGLVLALMIEGSGRWRGFYRAVHFLPVIATMAAMAVVWEAILHPTLGLLNRVLEGFGAHGPNWLRDEAWVLPSLIGIGVWSNLGFTIVMFMAGLRTIPRDLLDAAAVDGMVRPLDRARHLVLPLLSPITLFVALITAKRAFAVFDTVNVLTQGGPGSSSEVLVHLLYVEGFEHLRAGYGAAITVIYLALLLLISQVQRLVDRKIHYR